MTDPPYNSDRDTTVLSHLNSMRKELLSDLERGREAIKRRHKLGIISAHTYRMLLAEVDQQKANLIRDSNEELLLHYKYLKR